jgi:zinc protease
MRFRRTIATTTLALLATFGPGGDALAQRPEKAPALGPSPSLRLPASEERMLPNGLRVLYLANREQPVVTMSVMVRSGASSEPAAKAGLVQMTAALLDQGTKTRTAQQIAETIDSAGGGLGASAGWDATTVSTTVLKNRAATAADLLADVLRNPVFKDEEIDRIRTQTLNALQLSRSDAGTVADQVFDKVVFGASPYAHPIGGTPESVRALTRDDMVAFHAAHFAPNNATLVVVGDVTAKEAFELAERHFGSWEKRELPAEPAATAPAAAKRRIIVLDKPDAAQTEIRAGMAGIARADADYFAAVVTNAIFGATPFTSRIENELRVKRGLTYGAGSSFDTRLLGGSFQIDTNTKTETTAEAVQVILDEIARLQSGEVPADELSQRKKYLTGVFLVGLETPDAVATRLLQAELYGLGADYLTTYSKRVEAITAADVRRIATSRIVPDQFVIVLAGNAAQFEKELAKFGTVEKIPFDEVDLGSESLRRERKAAAAATGAEAAAGAERARATIAALGGDRYLNQKTEVASGSGKLSLPNGQSFDATIKNWVVYPHKTRTELDIAIAQIKQWSDGERAWVDAPGAGVQEITAQAKEGRNYGLDVLRWFPAGGWTARSIEGITVDGKALEGFAVADAEGHETLVYVDPATALPVRVKFETKEAPVEVRFADWRPVDGVLVAFRVEQWRGGAKFLEISYADVKVDAEVDAALFAAP